MIDDFYIPPVDKRLKDSLQKKIDGKTKPLGSLGQLEEIALKAGLIQNRLDPSLKNPHIVVFAGDHGIAREGVSAYPQEVTYQMVMNFVRGGAAINVFCRQHDIAIKVVDAGVNYDFPKELEIEHAKVDKGTKSSLREKAMTKGQCMDALERGGKIVMAIQEKSGCNIIGFGEMGIGNTSSASLLMSRFCSIPIEDCAGRGTGLDEEGFKRKLQILKMAREFHKDISDDPVEILSALGGFEIVMMAGAMLKAASLRMMVLVDGFIASSAFLSAYKMNSNLLDYAIFSHKSHEYAHGKMLEHLEVKPLLDLNLRLGEGTGAALSFPIIQSAILFLQDMASFESASVSGKI